MKCLLKYRWVKLPRAQLPQGKGVLGYWSRLAARAAFRKGTACYCGYHNEVVPGMWSGGIVGLKSILGVRRRAQALQIMDQLQSLGYIKYSLDQKSKRLDYQICDWVISCSGQGCSAGTVYATDGHGFLCLPRNITPSFAICRCAASTMVSMASISLKTSTALTLITPRTAATISFARLRRRTAIIWTLRMQRLPSPMQAQNPLLKLICMPNKDSVSLPEWSRTLSYLAETNLSINSYDEVDMVLNELFKSS